MAITFLTKEKRQRNLIYIFLVVILITAIILWLGYFKPKKPSPEITPPISELPTPPAEKLEINFEVLKNPFLEKLQAFEKLPPLEEEIGRENPFIPY